MTFYYTGIGSRKTPFDVCELMTKIARSFAASGMILRSGHADGADQAFELGAQEKAEIYLPWNSFNKLDDGEWIGEGPTVFCEPTQKAYKIAARFHPAWDRCGAGARSLHARNVHQVLGYDVDHPVLSSGIICWTPDGSLDGHGYGVGGTGQALRIAVAYGLHVTNLARPDHREMAERWLAENASTR